MDQSLLNKHFFQRKNGQSNRRREAGEGGQEEGEEGGEEGHGTQGEHRVRQRQGRQ